MEAQPDIVSKKNYKAIALTIGNLQKKFVINYMGNMQRFVN